MSRSIQRFQPRCGVCQKAKREFHNLEFVRLTKGGSVVVKCLVCGKVTTRHSWSARHRVRPSRSVNPTETSSREK